MIEQIDEHIHRALANFGMVDMHGSEARTDDMGVFGANQRHNFDIFRNAESRIRRGISDSRGKGIAIANEEAFLVGFEIFDKIGIGSGIGIVAIEDVIFLAEIFMGLDEGFLAMREQSTSIMNVEESHRLISAFFIIVFDIAAEDRTIRESDIRYFVADDLVIDDDARNVIRSDFIDIVRIELVIENDRSIDVA